jgi:5-methylcytosine-specific restriction enzyme subunit McrC
MVSSHVRRCHLTAFEHQSVPIEDASSETTITPQEADWLTALNDRRRGFCERGHRSVKLSQYSGLLTVGNRMLEILPKVDEAAPAEECRGILLNLLRESRMFPAFRHLSASHHLRDAPLLEVFITAFFEEVTALVRGGLLRRYQEESDDLAVVRGRLVAARQFAVHANRPDRIACQFDELTADNAWNRFLKAAVRAVRPWIGSIELHRRWTELVAVFEGVTDQVMEPDALRGFPFDRQARRYRDATEWARWILTLLSPSIRAGANTAPGLLFDMNLLFQSAVANALRREVEHMPHVGLDTQDSGLHLATVAEDGRNAFALRPDIVIRRGNEVVAVLDTKWKRLRGEPGGQELGVAPADAYQMHAYASTYGCREVTLVYPWHSGVRGPSGHVFQLATTGPVQPLLRLAFVDVRKSPLVLIGFDSDASATTPRTDHCLRSGNHSVNKALPSTASVTSL